MRKIISTVLAVSMITSLVGTTDSYATSKDLLLGSSYTVNDVVTGGSEDAGETPEDEGETVPADETSVTGTENGSGEQTDTTNEQTETTNEQSETTDEQSETTDEQSETTSEQSETTSEQTDTTKEETSTQQKIKMAPKNSSASEESTDTEDKAEPEVIKYDPIGSDEVKIIDTVYLKQDVIEYPNGQSSADRIHYLKLDDGNNGHTSDAIILESNGHFGLIDASNRSGDTRFGIQPSASGAAVLEYLEALGAQHLDFIVATHAHSDHLGGIPDVAKAMATENIVDSTTSGYTVKNENYTKLNPDTNQQVAVTDATELAELKSSLPTEKPKEKTVEEGDSVGVQLIDSNTTYIYKSFTPNSFEDSLGWANAEYYNAAEATMASANKVKVDNPSADALGKLGATFSGNGDGDIDDTISFYMGDFYISLYNLYSRSSSDENANSIVAYIEKAGQKTVLLADIDVYNTIEQDTAKAIAEQHGTIDVLKAAHHGYTKSNSKGMLASLSPKKVILTTTDRELGGVSPFYGYLKERNIPAYRTFEQQGNAIVEDLTGSLSLSAGKIVSSSDEELCRVVTEYNVTREITKKFGDTSTSTVNATKTVTEVENVVESKSVVKTTRVDAGIQLKQWIWNSGSGRWYMWWTSWESVDWVYVNADGSYAKGWQNINGYTYYFDEDGVMYKGLTKKDGHTVLLLYNGYDNMPEGSLAHGWVNTEDGWYYFDDNGYGYNGWLNSGGVWYYIDDGRMASNEWVDGYWINGDGTWTYEPIGTWHSNAKGWWFQDSTGWYAAGCWQRINGVWYYFDSEGYMAANEWREGKYLSASGAWDGVTTAMWSYDANGWKYTNGENWTATNCWLKISGAWYYFTETGYMASNEWRNGYWLSSGGAWTYAGTGSWRYNYVGWWFEDTNGWYPAGCWQKINGTWYYFETDGYLATNKYIGEYWVDASGACQ